MPNLPVNIDTTYADDAGDASRKTHQQHHDVLHEYVNTHSEEAGWAELPAVAAKLYEQRTSGPAQFRILTLGDSVGGLKMNALQAHFQRLAGGSFNGDAFSGVTYTNTGAVLLTSRYDLWYTGNVWEFGAGDVLSYGDGGVDATADLTRLYYVKEPGAGTFKVQIDGVDYQTLNADAAKGLGSLIIDHGSAVQRSYNIVGLTGTVHIIGWVYERRDRNGVAWGHLEKGGLALRDALGDTTVVDMFRQVVADFAPDLITYEAKEETDYETFRQVLWNQLDAAAPNAAVLLIGSTPRSGDATVQLAENADLKQAAVDREYVYWDGYSPLLDYDNMVALGMEGDGTHPHQSATDFLAGIMFRDLFLSQYGAVWPYDVDGDNLAARKKLIIGRLGIGELDEAAPQGYFEAEQTYGLDVAYYGERNLSFTGPNGTLMRLVLGGGGTTFLPGLVQVGDGNASVEGVSASRLRIRETHSGFNHSGDLQLRHMFRDRIMKTIAADGELYTPVADAGMHYRIDSAGHPFTFANPDVLGGIPDLRVQVFGTGVVTWGSRYRFPGGTKPASPSTATNQNVLTFFHDGQTGLLVCSSMSLDIG